MKLICQVFLVILALILVIVAGFWLYELETQPVKSASNDNVSGWAWSPNIGWISFNGDNYGINVDNNGKLSGYAWSDNVGWISFNESETGPPPSNDPCNDETCIAKAIPLGQFGKGDVEVRGWARALTACKDDLWDETNLKCTGSTAGNAAGGWDGWIRFDHGQDEEVYIDEDGNFHGWAWGSDVIGWISFNCGEFLSCAEYAGDACLSNENCSGEIFVAGDTENCCDATCSLKTCSQQAGDVCLVNENCPGTIISASDSDACCDATCELKTCSEQTGDICQANENCPGTIIDASDSDSCCDISCALKTCSEQGGDICLSNEDCPGSFISASNSDRCCNTACVLKTCADQNGYLCGPNEICFGNMIDSLDPDICCDIPCGEEACSDGTLYNECSDSRPLYCQDGDLVNKCLTCDCPAGKICNSSTGVCEEPETCSDGTLYDECSDSRPLYCEDGELVNKCLTCGCPAGLPYCDFGNFCRELITCDSEGGFICEWGEICLGGFIAVDDTDRCCADMCESF